MTERRCPDCGAQAVAEARFCGRCGDVLPVVTDPDHRSDAAAGDDGRASGDGPSAVGPGVDAPSTDRSSPGGWRATSRARLLAAAAVVVAAGATFVLATPGTDAIVLGAGLTIPSGPGPDASAPPTQQWARSVALADPLPPVVVDETVVVGGQRDGEPTVIGVDRTTGTRLWRSAGPGPGRIVLLAADGDDVAVVATGRDETTVSSFDARTGSETTERRTLQGAAETARALGDGRVLVGLVERQRPRARVVLVDREGTTADIGRGRTTMAVTAERVAATRDGAIVVADVADPTAAREIALDGEAASALGLLDDVVAVAQGSTLRGFDIESGEQRWIVNVDTEVAAVTASQTQLAVVAAGEDIGVDADGRTLWRGDGFPLPLVVDGAARTLLVRPGTDARLDLELLDEGGASVESIPVAQGDYLALGREVALSGVADEVVATSIEAPAPPAWTVDVEGRARWAVLAGPGMIVVAGDDGDITLSSWR